jgi:DNA-binding GntR family transcriptional regulator
MSTVALRALRPARRSVLADDVYERLRELVFDRRLAPRARLNMDQLARDLEVSATPVREALARLETEGLVEKVAHQGYRTTALLDAASFDSLYEARLVVEPTLARMAAERADDAVVRSLAQLAKRMRGASTGSTYREFSGFSSADEAFHDTVAQGAGNPHLRACLRGMRAHLHLSRLYVHHGIVDAGDAVPEHEALARAIADRDSDHAQALMRAHIERSQGRLREVLDAINVRERAQR